MTIISPIEIVLALKSVSVILDTLPGAVLTQPLHWLTILLKGCVILLKRQAVMLCVRSKLLSLAGIHCRMAAFFGSLISALTGLMIAAYA